MLVLREGNDQVSAEDIKAAGFEKPWRTRASPEQIGQGKPNLVPGSGLEFEHSDNPKSTKWDESEALLPAPSEFPEAGSAALDSGSQIALDSTS